MFDLFMRSEDEGSASVEAIRLGAEFCWWSQAERDTSVLTILSAYFLQLMNRFLRTKEPVDFKPKLTG